MESNSNVIRCFHHQITVRNSRHIYVSLYPLPEMAGNHTDDEKEAVTRMLERQHRQPTPNTPMVHEQTNE